jgi:O-antigen/teichoic acid export membrane protein
VFGAEFVEGAPALRIVALGMIVPVMVGTVGFILIMAGRTGWDLLVYMGAFGLDIVLALALAGPDALGIEGAAVAQAATLTFSAIARLLLVRRFLRIWPFDAGFARLLVPALAGAAAMALAHAVMPAEKWFLDLVVSFAVGGLVYVGVLVAVGLPGNERRSLFRMAGKVLGRRATNASGA